MISSVGVWGCGRESRYYPRKCRVMHKDLKELNENVFSNCPFPSISSLSIIYFNLPSISCTPSPPITTTLTPLSNPSLTASQHIIVFPALALPVTSITLPIWTLSLQNFLHLLPKNESSLKRGWLRLSDRHCRGRLTVSLWIESSVELSRCCGRKDRVGGSRLRSY